MKIRIVVALICITACSQLSLRSVTAAEGADQMRASLQNYFKAWNETDAGKRSELLENAWSPQGIYTDPTAHVEGRQALVKHIGQAISSPQFQGASLAPASEIDTHHQVFRFEWTLNDASGNVLIKGMDYGEFNDQGQITKIIGFFGPFPALK